MSLKQQLRYFGTKSLITTKFQHNNDNWDKIIFKGMLYSTERFILGNTKKVVIQKGERNVQ